MFFSKNKAHPIISPLSGMVVAISDVNEPIFSGRVVGDGIAIVPTTGEVRAPISGVVSFVGEQKHTLGITGFDGIEILIHIGINTVKLNGEGFEILVSKGDKVEVGQKLGSFDLALLHERNFDPTTPVVITSSAMDKVKRLVLRTGESVAGNTVCMSYVVAD